MPSTLYVLNQHCLLLFCYYKLVIQVHQTQFLSLMNSPYKGVRHIPARHNRGVYSTGTVEELIGSVYGTRRTSWWKEYLSWVLKDE